MESRIHRVQSTAPTRSAVRLQYGECNAKRNLRMARKKCVMRGQDGSSLVTYDTAASCSDSITMVRLP